MHALEGNKIWGSLNALEFTGKLTKVKSSAHPGEI
jgi:hypothetical protein